MAAQDREPGPGEHASTGRTRPRPDPLLDASRLSDADVVRRVLAGERELLELLVDRHGPALYATLRGRMRDVEDTREAFQETWRLAFERLGSLRDAQRFRAWLFAIALNELRRARRAEAAAPDPGALGGLQDPGREPDALAEDRELARRLAEAIAALPPRQRDVFRLRVTGGLAHAEIAALLGISEQNARVQHHLAVRRLRERLAQPPPREPT